MAGYVRASKTDIDATTEVAALGVLGPAYLAVSAISGYLPR